ncbi:MAG: protein kinase [Acidobacteria bacterium]|nr:protein kinase [Acidobacteriota bacterium]
MKECPKCEACYADNVNSCPHDQTPTRLSLPGEPLLANRYLLEKRIGSGAMGKVYLAKDKNLGTRRVAVKTVRQELLNSDDLQEGEAIARFEREARAAASISHPHIVDVTDFGETIEKTRQYFYNAKREIGRRWIYQGR